MGSKGSQTTTSSSAPPAAIMNAYQSALGMASQATSKPYQQYTGQLVAGLSPQQQQGISNIDAAQGMALPAIQKGMDYTNNAAQGITPGLYNRFYSPYVTDVANQTQRNLMESNAQQMSGLKGGAIRAGAFGGDRAGIAQAEMARQQDLAMGQTMGNIYQQGYGQAMGLAGAQVQNLAQMGQQIAGLGAGAQTSAISGGQADIAAGAQAQATQQAQLQAAYDQYQQYQAYPYQQAQFYGNIAEGIGAGAGGSGSTSTPGPSLASTIFGGLGALGSIMSDRRVKENIKPVGKLKDGQTVYSYNFKGHPQTQIGLIAQEVEKTHPEAVHEVNGLKAVNYEAATRDAKASGGGLVLPEDARRGFSFGGIPYLTGDAEGRLGWIPKSQHNVSFNKKPGISPVVTPPPEYVDQPLDKSWGDLNPLSPSQVAGLKGLVGKIIPPTATGLDPMASAAATSSYDYTGAPMLKSGGLVRGHFADGGFPDINSSVTQPDKTQLSTGVAPPPAGATIVPANDNPPASNPFSYAMDRIRQGSSTQTQAAGETAPHQRNLIESLLSKDLSPEARAGILSGSFALMGSRSPWFGQALGDAGKVGMQTYYNALGQQKDLAEKAANIGLQQQQANEAAATASSSIAGATEKDISNWYVAKSAYDSTKRPNDPEFPGIIEWLKTRGKYPAQTPKGSISPPPPTIQEQIASAPVVPQPGTQVMTPKGLVTAHGVEGPPMPPAPGNVLASETGQNPNIQNSLPWALAQQKDLYSQLHAPGMIPGNPRYAVISDNYARASNLVKDITGSDDYKAMKAFRDETAPALQQALDDAKRINSVYHGGSLAEQQAYYYGLNQTLGLGFAFPKDAAEVKALHDELVKDQADIISSLAAQSQLSERAPAASIGISSARVPPPEASEQARALAYAKIQALKDYRSDQYNTWNVDQDYSSHQKDFSTKYPIRKYFDNAQSKMPPVAGAPSGGAAIDVKLAKALSSKFPDVPTGQPVHDPKNPSIIYYKIDSPPYWTTIKP